LVSFFIGGIRSWDSAMLAAQSKEDASRVANAKEMEDKQKEIDKLEKRVAQLEEELEQKKALIQQIEEKMKAQKEKSATELSKLQHQVHHLNTTKSHRRSPTPPSPGGHRGTPSPSISTRKTADDASLPSVAENMVSPEVLAEHRAELSRLEDELEAERQHRRAADGEIIKLRAAMGGVQLSDSDVNALLPKAMESLAPAQSERIDEGEEEEDERLDERYVRWATNLCYALFFFWRFLNAVASFELDTSRYPIADIVCSTAQKMRYVYGSITV